MRHLTRALRYFRQDLPRIVGALLLLLFATAANMLKPWPLAWIVDSVLGKKPFPPALQPWLAQYKPEFQLLLLAAAILALHTAHAVFSAGQSYLLIQTGLRGLARVRRELFARLHRLSLRFHQGQRAGDLVYRASWDSYSFQTLFQQGLFALIPAALSLGFMLFIMARINGRLTLVTLGIIPFLGGAIRFFAGRMNRYGLTAHETDARVSATFQQSVSILPLTLAENRVPEEEKRFEDRVEQALFRRQRQHGCEVLYLAMVALIFGLSVAVVVWMGVREVWSRHLTLGQLLVFVAYLGQLYDPLNQLSHVGTIVADGIAGTQRVFEILDTPEEVIESPTARPARAALPESIPSESAPEGSRWGAHPRLRSGQPPLSIRGNWTFRGVSFGYLAERSVLQDLNFSVAAGQVVGLIGPSGSGKSTLLQLLLRLYDPTAGSIELEAVDLRQLRLADLRRCIAFVPQNPLILSGTIAENIAVSRPEADLGAIRAAAEAAQADTFIRRLPAQYETQVGEGAARLSAGEQQRLGLARAFLKAAPILLLDEPTSALDDRTARQVHARLREHFRGRTVFFVTHRRELLAGLETVLVLENGRLSSGEASG